MSKISIIVKCSACPWASFIHNFDRKRVYLGCGLINRGFDWWMTGLMEGDPGIAEWCPLPSITPQQELELGLLRGQESSSGGRSRL